MSSVLGGPELQGDPPLGWGDMTRNFQKKSDSLSHRRVFLSYQYEHFSLGEEFFWSLLHPAHVLHFWGKTTISLLKN